jgi:hypothetical protein
MYYELWGGKGIKAKGWGSCYWAGWEFVTTSKKLALQVSKAGFFAGARGFLYIMLKLGCMSCK